MTWPYGMARHDALQCRPMLLDLLEALAAAAWWLIAEAVRQLFADMSPAEGES